MGLRNMTEEQKAMRDQKRREGVARKALFVRNRPSAINVLATNSEDVSKWVNSVPLRFQARVNQGLAGKLSLGQSVRAHCEQCCGYEEIPERIVQCKVWRCMLWSNRPYQN